MATSNSYNYSITAEKLITAALRKIGKVKNDTAKAPRSLLDAGLDELNQLIKHLHTDGLQMWSRKRATLFPALNTNEYSIGPTGTHCTNTYVKTEMAVAGVATDLTLTVDSSTGISSGDNIGVILDSGNIHWTTVNGAPVGDVVTLTDALPSAVAIDKNVYAYTSKIQRPLKILDIWRHHDDGSDNSIAIISISEYSEQTTKTQDGTPTTAVYQPTLTNGTLFTWTESDDLTTLVQFWYQQPLQDVDSLTDDIDFPQEYYLMLVYNLASILADSYDDIDPTRASRINRRAMQYKDEALGWDMELSSITLQPDTRYGE